MIIQTKGFMQIALESNVISYNKFSHSGNYYYS